MYSAAFIFEPGTYDDAFYILDNEIQDIAESVPGFLGKESWQSADGKKFHNIYYWRDKESLKQFSTAKKHIEAKRQYQKWYKGYHVIISEIQHTHGDGNLPHLLSGHRR